MEESTYRPNARRDGVLVEALDEELLVFDSERQCAHSLNACAAKVWEACDGSRSVSELAEECQEDESTVLMALARLRDVHLLDQTEVQLPAGSPEREGVSRRMMLRKSVVAGAGVGLAIPVIRSITAPSIAMASSGRGINPKNNMLGCTSDNQCSPGSFCQQVSAGGAHRCKRKTGQPCSTGSFCSFPSGGDGTGGCPTGGAHPHVC